MPPLEGNVWHTCSEQQNKVFSLYLIQFIHSWTDCPELVFWNSTHGKHSIQQLSVVYLRMQGNNQDKKKDWDAFVQWVFSVFLVQLPTLPVRWASWKELKGQAYFIACPERCAEELCPKCLLVLWMSKHKLTLVPKTK